MPWAKLDDRFHDNRKVRKVWRRCPAALGLHVMAITYSAAHLLDGRIDAEFVEDQIGSPRAREQAISALVDSGLWDAVTDGWVIHDYLEYNPSRQDTETKRAAKREAGRKGGVAKSQNRRKGSSNELAGARHLTDGSYDHGSTPDPTRPEPDTAGLASYEARGA